MDKPIQPQRIKVKEFVLDHELAQSEAKLKEQLANAMQTPQGRDQLNQLANEIATSPFTWADRYK